jgi:hypothetical protein
MPIAGVLTLPPTPGNKIKLENFLAFLRSDSKKGEHTIVWECPASKQLVGLHARKFDEDTKYPMSIEIIAPKIFYLPFLSHALTPDDVRELISICKVELDTKWYREPKIVTFSS